MKKIFRKLAYLTFAALMLNSCELDEFNPSAGDATLTSFEAWSGLQAYSYTCLNDELYTASDWMFASEGGTDAWVAKQNGTGYKQLFYYEDMTASFNSSNKLFKQCYSMLTNCNTVINEAVNLTDGDPEAIKVLIAETKTLRALYYSILVVHFGPVMLNLESSAAVTGKVDLNPKRSSEKDIYDQIIKDLKEAVPDLGVLPYNNNRARMTKKSAMGLLARVYAQRAGLGDSKYNDGAEYWKLAAETAEELITNAATFGAHLYTDIADVWADANNRSNKEALIISAGPDAYQSAWQYTTKNNKLSAYSTGGSYSDFFNSNHKPGDKGYFYGRLNSQTWQPTKYLLYCFNPEWDKRWEYTFQTAWVEWSMVQCGWVSYSQGQKKITGAMCAKYAIDSSFIGKTIYPYADCNGLPSTFGGNQYPAKVWAKGDHSGDASKLLTVAPSADKCGTTGYTQTTKVYAIPHPVAPDDDRINTLFVHEPVADAKNRIYPVVVLKYLYDENDLPYGGVAQGSAAGNPPLIGNGSTSSGCYPGLIKFNWSFDGCFEGSNLQIKTGDMFIMRMAEIYLLAAEANQMLGKGGKAAEYLNVLRKRAARNGVAESTWKLSNATLEDIFDENARELAGEFTRWALLKRHNAFEERLAKYNKRASNSFKPFHYNRPISYDFLSTILNAEEFGDNGYGTTANSGLKDFE